MRKIPVMLAAIFCLQSCNRAENKGAELAASETEAVSTDFNSAGINATASAALPVWFREAQQKQQLDRQYNIGNWIQPNFLTGDFDGDHNEDIAFLAENIKTGEKGLIILHQDQWNSYTVFGAGTEFEEMGDMSWIGIFEKIQAGERVAPTLFDETTGDIIGEDSLHAVVLKADAVFIHQAEECGGGIIYKKDKSYSWINQE